MDAATCFSHHSEVERACGCTLYICLLGRGCSHCVMVLHHRPVQVFPVGDTPPLVLLLNHPLTHSSPAPASVPRRAVDSSAPCPSRWSRKANRPSSQTSRETRELSSDLAGWEREALWSFKLHLWSDLYHIYVCMDMGSLCCWKADCQLMVHTLHQKDHVPKSVHHPVCEGEAALSVLRP